MTRASTVGAAGLHGNTLAAFAPRVDPATVKTAQPHVVSGSIANASVNRGTNINTPLAGANGARTAGATPQQVQAAKLAQGNAVSGAKITQANTQPSRPLTRSLTSLQTTAANTGKVTSHVSTPPATGSVATGASATRHAVTPSANASPEATYTGAPTTRHTLAPVRSPEAAFTGAQATRHTTSANAESTFTGAPTTRHTLSPSGVGGGSAFTHSSAPSYYRQPSSSVFNTRAPSFYNQSSAPAFRSSSPSYSYHPQPSFHSSAPVSHFSAPEAHFSGGGFSGGGRSFGGGGGGPRWWRWWSPLINLALHEPRGMKLRGFF